MKCEYCGRTLREGDLVHGIKYGTLTATGFKAAKDSAEVVICEPCGNKVYQYLYSTLDSKALAYPVIFKMVAELSSLVKNGYKLIQNISQLPAPDQQALQHLITSCKSAQ
ncbi:hypothetical protein [Geomonas subterranea]|uniref:hypothetical protein n=1 Tax=Geomonas subterranea TaxID=2847989 RepID=UPI001CD73B8A|nr:hypothetical protein [Geomonas fuzhouensis]